MPYSNKEKKREYNKKYYELNIEKRAEHYQLNKEKMREKSAEYYQLNKEKSAEYSKKYKELNREKIREQRAKYRQKKRAICLEYLGGKCVKCGTTERLEFDHIKRDTKKYNIASRVHQDFTILKEELNKCQLLCVPCHLDKTAKEWAFLRGDA